MWLTFLAKVIGNFVRGEIKNIEGILIEKVKKEVIEHLAGGGQMPTAPILTETALNEAKKMLLKDSAQFIDKLLEEGQNKPDAAAPAVQAWFADARSRIKNWGGL